MAYADGTVVIDTEIDTDGIQAGSEEVEARIRNLAKKVNNIGATAKAALNKQIDAFAKLNNEYAAQEQKVESLRKKVAEYGNQKIPTDEYKEIQAQIAETTAKQNRLIEARDRYLANGGKTSSNTYKKQTYDLEELANTIKYAEGELKDLEERGKAFTTGTGTKEAKKDIEKLAQAERKLADMNNRLKTSYAGITSKAEEYGKKAEKANNRAKVSAKKASGELDKVSRSSGRARMGLGRMLAMSLMMSVAFRAFSAIFGGIKSGFDNLAQYSGTTNQSISMLWSSLVRLQNALATAFAPILTVVAPILTKFIDMLSTAASYVSMFFSFLSGKSTYTRAIAVQKNYAASLGDTASAAKDAADATEDAAKAAEDYLSPLDDINKYTAEDSSSKSPSSGSGGAGGGVGATEPMFEDVAITDIPILEKLKDILSQIFKPFKQAWQQEGKATIDAAKLAFTNLKSLAKDVGKSMLEVWTNGTGTQLLSTTLQIAQAVLTTIGRIAGRLDEAWNKNSVGTAIIQAIADILQKILDFVNRIAWATADWAAKLDFYPLLDSIRQ